MMIGSVKMMKSKKDSNENLEKVKKLYTIIKPKNKLLNTIRDDVLIKNRTTIEKCLLTKTSYNCSYQ